MNRYAETGGGQERSAARRAVRGADCLQLPENHAPILRNGLRVCNTQIF